MYTDMMVREARLDAQLNQTLVLLKATFLDQDRTTLTEPDVHRSRLVSVLGGTGEYYQRGFENGCPSPPYSLLLGFHGERAQ